MPLRDEFEHDILKFFRDHATMVNGGAIQNLVGGGTVGASIVAQGAQSTQKAPGVAAKAGVSLNAPIFSASFAETRAAENADMLDFSRPQVTVTLAPYAPGGLPVYLIPYEGGSARGIKLPAHGTDGHNVAYAMTATQNGCTVEVSGTAVSPYASHSNVIDVKNDDAAQKWIAREQKINLRLFKLQQRFTAAEVAAGGNAANVPLNRTQFGFYDQTATGGAGASSMKNYNSVMVAAGNAGEGQFGKAKREERRIGHYRYMCVPTAETIEGLKNRASPPNALVVGRRTAAGWTFYYQVYTDVTFNIKRVPKISGFKLGEGEYIMKDDDATKRKRFSATAILAYGELWPNMTEVSCTFGLGH